MLDFLSLLCYTNNDLLYEIRESAMLSVKLLKPYHSFQSNTYLITSLDKSAVIDPSVPFDESLVDGQVEYILLTHGHFDHMLDVDSWVSATGAKVVVSVCDADALSDPRKNCYKLFDGSDNGYFGEYTTVSDEDVIHLGDSEIRVMACPGHTPGSLTYLCDGIAFVGDTVFSGGGYGRVDLPGGNRLQLCESIRKILSLPDDTVLYSGHGDFTTVKEYKQDIGYKNGRIKK